MRMTASELERYRAELEQTARAAREYVLRRLDEEGQGLDVAGMRELAIEIVEDATGVFGDVAQDIACELFDEVMEADGETARATTFDGLIDHGRTEEKVRYYACDLVDGDRAGFDGRSADLAAYYVHRSAWDNLVRNCDLGHVRWARVPTGRDTCLRCLREASRGFVYHSEDSASHGKHRGCNCVVVPGNDGASIEGYDPDELYDRWRHPERYEAATALGKGERGKAVGNLQPPQYVETIDVSRIEDEVRRRSDEIRYEPVEHAWVFCADGRVFHAVGDESGVMIDGDGVDLDGAIVTHNHPLGLDGSVSFGADDYDKMRQHPRMKRLEAHTPEYDYYWVPMRPLDRLYGEFYRSASRRIIALGNNAPTSVEIQHETMEEVMADGYCHYRRVRVRGDRRAEG